MRIMECFGHGLYWHENRTSIPNGRAGDEWGHYIRDMRHDE